MTPRPTTPLPVPREILPTIGVAVLAAALLVAPAALASDGVVEINQVRALAGDVTPGDGPGFPVTLTLPGSYRLTGNLDLLATADPKNTSGIRVEVDGVSIDLNGFAILGEVVCDPEGGEGVSCEPMGGTGHGIEGEGLTVAHRVWNGTVAGMGADGVQARNVSDVVARSNGGIGISASLVRDSLALHNGWHGIDSRVTTASVASVNGNKGILSEVVRGSTADGNVGTGIDAAVVVDSRAEYNGVGIQGELVHGSLANFNDGYGVAVLNPDRHAIGATVQYINNGGGDQTNATNAIGDNLCDGAPCP